MKEFLADMEKNEKTQWKHRLLYWGGAIDLCARKHEEIRKIIRVKEECVAMLAEVAKVETGKEITEAYEREIARIGAEVEEILGKKREIDVMVAKLDLEEQEFLYLRFVKGYSYEYISMKISQSRANCFRLQDRILDQLIEMNVETL